MSSSSFLQWQNSLHQNPAVNDSQEPHPANPKNETDTRRNFSENFHSQDPDTITFLSSDKVHFNIHRKNLETQTGGFPSAPEFTHTPGEVVALTETAETLELLFQFLYPRQHPDLADTPFAVLAPLAEAAEKYEVFPAMNICRIRMRNALIHGNAVEVFNYASRHDYKDILLLAAPLLLDLPIDQVLRDLSPERVVPWIRYRSCWSRTARTAITAHAPEHYALAGAELLCAYGRVPPSSQPNLPPASFSFSPFSQPPYLQPPSSSNTMLQATSVPTTSVFNIHRSQEAPRLAAATSTTPTPCRLNTTVLPSQLWVKLGDRRSRDAMLALYNMAIGTCSENHYRDYSSRRARLEDALNAAPGFDTFL